MSKKLREIPKNSKNRCANSEFPLLKKGQNSLYWFKRLKQDKFSIVLYFQSTASLQRDYSMKGFK